MKRFLNIIVLSLFALNAAPAFSGEAVKLEGAAFTKAEKVFFAKCAGCHGVLRGGGMGPSLLPEKTRDEMGTQKIEKLVSEGTAHGMPSFGTDKLLTAEQITLVAGYIQHDPANPPGLPLSDIKASWKVLVPVKDRPKKPASKNWHNFFGVVLKEVGKTAIIDGDSKEKIVELMTGYGTHILRVSKSGRYLYSVDRRGGVSAMDLWAKTPNIVAQVRTCIQSRSAETSKFKGYEDKALVVGCSWPSHIVSLDGQTLEPLQLINTSSDPKIYSPDQGVVGIAASHSSPEWIVNARGTGSAWVVDYSNPAKLKTTKIALKQSLNDGGWDSTKNYFMAAAKERDAMVVIDARSKKQIAEFKIESKPEHPGRSANWIDPKYGPVSATVSGKGAKLFIWGSDPKGHPEHAWKIVHTIDFASALKKAKKGGLLYIKTHPKSKHVWVDFLTSPKKKVRQSICVFNKEDIAAVPQCQRISQSGKVLNPEYNMAGDEVWLSVFDTEGQIIVLDDTAPGIKIKANIKGLNTPTGKFNIHNHMNDIY